MTRLLIAYVQRGCNARWQVAQESTRGGCIMTARYHTQYNRIATFLCLASCKGDAKAAGKALKGRGKRGEIKPKSVMDQVSELAKDLKLPLLDKKNKISVAGLVLAAKCIPSLNKIDNIFSRAEKDTLTIGITHYIASNFINCLPLDKKVSIVQAKADVLIQKLQALEIDFMLGPGLGAQGLETIGSPITIPYKFVSTDKKSDIGKALSLGNYHWICHEPGTATRKNFDTLVQNEKLTNPEFELDPVATSDDELILLNLVAQFQKKNPHQRYAAILPWGPRLQAAICVLNLSANTLPRNLNWPPVSIGVHALSGFLDENKKKIGESTATALRMAVEQV